MPGSALGSNSVLQCTQSLHLRIAPRVLHSSAIHFYSITAHIIAVHVSCCGNKEEHAHAQL